MKGVFDCEPGRGSMLPGADKNPADVEMGRLRIQDMVARTRAKKRAGAYTHTALLVLRWENAARAIVDIPLMTLESLRRLPSA